MINEDTPGTREGSEKPWRPGETLPGSAPVVPVSPVAPKLADVQKVTFEVKVNDFKCEKK